MLYRGYEIDVQMYTVISCECFFFLNTMNYSHIVNDNIFEDFDTLTQNTWYWLLQMYSMYNLSSPTYM